MNEGEFDLCAIIIISLLRTMKFAHRFDAKTGEPVNLPSCNYVLNRCCYLTLVT